MAATETHTIDTADLDVSARDITAGLNSVRGLALGGIAVGLIGLVLGVIIGATQGDAHPLQTVLQAYLYGFTFWLALTLGCTFLVILHNVIRATWTLSILRIAEAGAKNLPAMFGLFLPFLISVWAGGALGFYLYHWADPQEVAGDKVLQHKQLYLNPVGWTIRAFIFFAIWWAYVRFLSNSGLQQDKTKNQALAQTRTDWASPGIVIFAVTLTFATTDWLMSLDPHWFSTIYGVWWGIAGVLCAIAFSVFWLLTFHDRRPFSYIVTPALTKDLGNLMLGTTMFWTYITLSQFLIYWSGNLPEYITFFVDRFRGPWVYVGAFIIVAQFFLPFLLLLSGRTKRTIKFLRGVAAWIVLVRAVDILWQTIPYFQWELSFANIGGFLIALAGFAFVGGVWMTGFISNLKANPVIPTYDTRLIEAKLQGGHH